MKVLEIFVTLASANFDDVVTFYERLFERSPASEIPEKYAEFQLYGLKLTIFKPKTTHRSEFGNATGSGLSLCVEVDNLDGAIDRLVALGYPPLGEVTVASHGREIYAYDPDGNRLILHESK